MYAGRVACCPLLSHAEYAPRALLRKKTEQADGQTDGRTPDRCITLTARRGQRDHTKSRTCNKVSRSETLVVMSEFKFNRDAQYNDDTEKRTYEAKVVWRSSAVYAVFASLPLSLPADVARRFPVTSTIRQRGT